MFLENVSLSMAITHYPVMQYDDKSILTQGGGTRFAKRQRCKICNTVVHSTEASCAEILRAAFSVRWLLRIWTRPGCDVKSLLSAFAAVGI